ncbi:hypothetical protein PFISCL1PPCAC_21323, partial [Pristionchus fissidentatus]
MPSDPDLVIRLEVDHVSEPSFEGSASSVFYAKDLPWNLFVKSEESGGANYVDAGLVCSLESEGLGWSYDALAEFHLINTNTCHANKVRQVHRKLQNKVHGIVCDKLITWDEIARRDSSRTIASPLRVDCTSRRLSVS